MAEVATVARPYAEAAFAYASENNALQQWSEVLQAMAELVASEEMSSIVTDPRVDRQMIVDAIAEQAGLADDVKNLLSAMADNNRLGLMSSVSSMFDELKAQADKTINATVTAAFELNDQQKQTLAAALSKRLDAEVVVECEVNKDLIGGAVVKAGDLVIDGSVASQLRKLSAALAQ